MGNGYFRTTETYKENKRKDLTYNYVDRVRLSTNTIRNYKGPPPRGFSWRHKRSVLHLDLATSCKNDHQTATSGLSHYWSQSFSKKLQHSRSLDYDRFTQDCNDHLDIVQLYWPDKHNNNDIHNDEKHNNDDYDDDDEDMDDNENNTNENEDEQDDNDAMNDDDNKMDNGVCYDPYNMRRARSLSVIHEETFNDHFHISANCGTQRRSQLIPRAHLYNHHEHHTQRKLCRNHNFNKNIENQGRQCRSNHRHHHFNHDTIATDNNDRHKSTSKSHGNYQKQPATHHSYTFFQHLPNESSMHSWCLNNNNNKNNHNDSNNNNNNSNINNDKSDLESLNSDYFKNSLHQQATQDYNNFNGTTNFDFTTLERAAVTLFANDKKLPRIYQSKRRQQQLQLQKRRKQYQLQQQNHYITTTNKHKIEEEEQEEFRARRMICIRNNEKCASDEESQTTSVILETTTTASHFDDYSTTSASEQEYNIARIDKYYQDCKDIDNMYNDDDDDDDEANYELISLTTTTHFNKTETEATDGDTCDNDDNDNDNKKLSLAHVSQGREDVLIAYDSVYLSSEEDISNDNESENSPPTVPYSASSVVLEVSQEVDENGMTMIEESSQRLCVVSSCEKNYNVIKDDACWENEQLDIKSAQFINNAVDKLANKDPNNNNNNSNGSSSINIMSPHIQMSRTNLAENQYHSLPDVSIGRSLKVSECIDAKLRSSYNLIKYQRTSINNNINDNNAKIMAHANRNSNCYQLRNHHNSNKSSKSRTNKYLIYNKERKAKQLDETTKSTTSMKPPTPEKSEHEVNNSAIDKLSIKENEVKLEKPDEEDKEETITPSKKTDTETEKFVEAPLINDICQIIPKTSCENETVEKQKSHDRRVIKPQISKSSGGSLRGHSNSFKRRTASLQRIKLPPHVPPIDEEYLRKVDAVRAYWSKLQCQATNELKDPHEIHILTNLQKKDLDNTTTVNAKSVLNECENTTNSTITSHNTPQTLVINKNEENEEEVNLSSSQQFDHIRYKVVKSEQLICRNVLNRSTQLDELLHKYLQEYSFHELFAHNNVVIVEPVRTNITRPLCKHMEKCKSMVMPNYDEDTSLTSHNCNHDNDSIGLSMTGGTGLKKHFFFQPIRVNRELYENELPNPDTVRKVRKYFEDHQFLITRRNNTSNNNINIIKTSKDSKKSLENEIEEHKYASVAIKEKKDKDVVKTPHMVQDKAKIDGLLQQQHQQQQVQSDYYAQNIREQQELEQTECLLAPVTLETPIDSIQKEMEKNGMKEETEIKDEIDKKEQDEKYGTNAENSEKANYGENNDEMKNSLNHCQNQLTNGNFGLKYQTTNNNKLIIKSIINTINKNNNNNCHIKCIHLKDVINRHNNNSYKQNHHYCSQHNHHHHHHHYNHYNKDNNNQIKPSILIKDNENSRLINNIKSTNSLGELPAICCSRGDGALEHEDNISKNEMETMSYGGDGEFKVIAVDNTDMTFYGNSNAHDNNNANSMDMLPVNGGQHNTTTTTTKTPISPQQKAQTFNGVFMANVYHHDNSDINNHNNNTNMDKANSEDADTKKVFATQTTCVAGDSCVANADLSEVKTNCLQQLQPTDIAENEGKVQIGDTTSSSLLSCGKDEILRDKSDTQQQQPQDNSMKMQAEIGSNMNLGTAKNINSSNCNKLSIIDETVKRHYVANDKLFFNQRKYDDIEFEEFQVYKHLSEDNETPSATSHATHMSNKQKNSLNINKINDSVLHTVVTTVNTDNSDNTFDNVSNLNHELVCNYNNYKNKNNNYDKNSPTNHDKIETKLNDKKYQSSDNDTDDDDDDDAGNFIEDSKSETDCYDSLDDKL